MTLHAFHFAGITPLRERRVSPGLGHISSGSHACIPPYGGVSRLVVHAREIRRRTSGRYAFRCSYVMHACRCHGSRCGMHTPAPLPRSSSAASLGVTQSLHTRQVGPARPRPGERALRASTEIPASLASKGWGRLAARAAATARRARRCHGARRPPDGSLHAASHCDPLSGAGASASRLQHRRQESVLIYPQSGGVGTGRAPAPAGGVRRCRRRW